MSSRARIQIPQRKKRHRVALTLFILLLFLAAIAAVALGVCMWWLRGLPDYTNVNDFNDSQPSIMYANDSKTVLARFRLENRIPVTMNNIAPVALKSVVAIEDERFYTHGGVDLWGIARASFNNITGGSREGASTITQQLVRNTILADEMNDISLKRKIREAVLALKIEDNFSKDDILTMYLNAINFGSGAYGIEAASQRYFSKHARELTLTEAALLAGIPQSPTYNNPLKYPQNAINRRNLVLQRMVVNGYISQDDYNRAVSAPLGLKPTEFSDGIVAYPYFSSFVISQLKNNYKIPETQLKKGALRIITTLDPFLQQTALDVADKKRQTLGENHDIAMTVIEPQTGFIKALVGGENYDVSQVNLATGAGGGGRPCGSAFKAFTLVTALEKGISPNTTVDCNSPATIDGYTLSNDGNKSYGTRSLASALAISSNTGFVRLIASIGISDVVETAHRMGIKSQLDARKAGAALTLGTENVTTLEMTEAYATIASEGVHRDSTPIEFISNARGQVLIDNRNPVPRSKRVLTKEVAYAAEQALELVVSRGTGTGARLASGQAVAGKTGTSQNYNDVTFYGITPQYAVGIWAGSRGKPTPLKTGTHVTDVFADFMKVALSGMPPQQFVPQESPEYEYYSDPKHQIHGVHTSSHSYSLSDDEESSRRSSRSHEENTQSESNKSSHNTKHAQDKNKSAAAQGEQDASGTRGTQNTQSSGDSPARKESGAHDVPGAQRGDQKDNKTSNNAA